MKLLRVRRSIGQSIYFVNIEKDLVFNMYDERNLFI
ncbi:DUF3885 domain-containing protein [Paenibacillus monticola]